MLIVQRTAGITNYTTDDGPVTEQTHDAVQITLGDAPGLFSLDVWVGPEWVYTAESIDPEDVDIVIMLWKDSP